MKIISKIKQAISRLPENKLVKKYLIWVIILSFIVAMLPSFSYDGIQVAKAIYTTNNLPWPPQLNEFNFKILRDLLGMTLLLFVLYALLTPLFLIISSFIIKKILNLFKKDIGFLKLCNISLFSDLVVSSLSVMGLILYVIFSYLFPYYRDALGRNFILEPIFFIGLVLTILLYFGSWIVGLIIYIFGIKISLKEYKPKIK